MVRDFPADAFDFAVVDHRYPALVWREAGGAHQKGKVAYWLRREVTQKQDRGLLPSDENYKQIGQASIVRYLQTLTDAPTK